MSAETNRDEGDKVIAEILNMLERGWSKQTIWGMLHQNNHHWQGATAGDPYRELLWQEASKRHKKERQLKQELADRLAQEDAQEQYEELRQRLAKGKWFLKGAEVLVERSPVYYDRTAAWWLWNSTTCCWEERDETDVLVMCRAALQLLGDTSVKHGGKLLEALRQVSRSKAPLEPPLECIQFGTQFFNINTGERMPSTPDYFSTNPIPWNIGTSTETPVMDELITSWVGEEYRQTVYEIIAYCTYRDYPIHRIFCFIGTGANGKTRLLKIIQKFIGQQNSASVTLKKIGTNDFALYPLYRKLTCFIGETAHHRIESSEILKALSGQDPVSFEDKGRTAFTGTNYAKMIIGTNVLPPSTDNSRGWHRRWLSITFPNEFQEGEDVLARIPDAEYENLAAKTLAILPGLLKRGVFSREGTIEQRQAKYQELSNPLKSFLSTFYERDQNEKERYTETYLEYLTFLASKKLRRISKKEFSEALEDESLETQKTSQRDPMTGNVTSFNVIWGIKRKPPQRCIPHIPCIPDSQVSPKNPIEESGNGLEGMEYKEYKDYKPAQPRITDEKSLLQHLRDAKMPLPRSAILEAVHESVGGYTDREFWLDVNLKRMEKEGNVIGIGADSWTVLE